MNSLGDAGAVMLGGFWLMWRYSKEGSREFLVNGDGDAFAVSHDLVYRSKYSE